MHGMDKNSRIAEHGGIWSNGMAAFGDKTKRKKIVAYDSHHNGITPKCGQSFTQHFDLAVIVDNATRLLLDVH